MTSETALTLAFLSQAPKAAAEELQRLPLNEAAALIGEVPTRFCAPVLDSMIPWHAARILELLFASRAAAVLRQLRFADSISLARLLSADKRDAIIEELPTNYGRRLASALRYPRHQVGAWLDPEVPILSTKDTVHDALRVLKAADSASHIFVESEGHEKFIGMIPIREILRAERSMTLDRLTIAHPDPVSNRASLSSLAFDERWDDFLQVPVVGRRGNLLGGLSRQSLRHAIHEQHVTSADSSRSLVGEVLGAFSVTCLAMLRLLASDTSSRQFQRPEV